MIPALASGVQQTGRLNVLPGVVVTGTPGPVGDSRANDKRSPTWLTAIPGAACSRLRHAPLAGASTQPTHEQALETPAAFPHRLLRLRRSAAPSAQSCGSFCGSPAGFHGDRLGLRPRWNQPRPELPGPVAGTYAERHAAPPVAALHTLAADHNWQLTRHYSGKGTIMSPIPPVEFSNPEVLKARNHRQNDPDVSRVNPCARPPNPVY